MRSLVRLWLAGACLLAPGAARGADELRFVRDGAEVKRVDLATLMRACTVTTVEIDDPQYAARKRYRACPFGRVLAFGFGEPAAALAGTDVFLRAWDGYDRATDGDRFAEEGAYLAFGDADLSHGDTMRWAPIGPKAVDPAPLYLVWAKAAQRDPHRYPWPYQLVEIEVADFAKAYPHSLPTSAPRDGAAWRGFAIFRGECIACHSINREGGKVGPDLNVPKSIVEYRPVDQIKQYIRDPSFFRYGNMPAHPHLGPEDLDALVAYFRTMRGLKHDPGGAR